ncbi:hypothetical protein [Thioflexithrix psekupsensis]|uniref:Uncharacterized protein n=1 Tax=Thioflexithrix psekupsensis TaxID=1570016 RepID=A0A251X546_9GAMM|nr:hypothetical protein [Thioflexithrix psekupsensis]OUD12485.1 hypothetical protein TPSD3_15395 [Thioflexithrix psekupsensis]
MTKTYRNFGILIAFVMAMSALSMNVFADSRYAFTVTYLWYGPDINVESIGSGNVYRVGYNSSIETVAGDTVTIIIDDDNNWKTIINERNGKSATINSVRRQ